MCLEQGGDLLTIATDKEKITINKRIKVLNGISSLWISLNDRDFKDVQYWSDGEAAGLFNWGSGSPSKRDSDRYSKKHWFISLFARLFLE